MWRETHDAVLRECAERSGGCAAEKLLAAVTDKVDFTAEAAKAQLSTIGKELTRPLRDVLAVDTKTPRIEKLSLFKLQVVCRLFMCCEEGVFGAADEDDELAQARLRGKKKASAKRSKKNPARPTSVRSELRELLDRIALLIDSANPPSLADSEDEPSPFHTFLISVLEKRLGLLLPEVFEAIRQIYELTEDEQPVVAPLSTVSPAPKEEKPATDGPADSSNILSALKDKRPSKKRSLLSTSDAFKEMILPGQPSKPRTMKPSALKLESERTVRAPSHAKQPSASARESTKRPRTDSSLVSLAAASKKSRPGRPTTSLLPKSMSMPMPMLVRNVDRQMLQMRSMGIATNGAVSANSSAPNGLVRQQATARSTGPSPSQLSRSSVVMRTPDRPQRVQRSQPRILVEASPPLRNPFATARLRRPGSQMPK